MRAGALAVVAGLTVALAVSLGGGAAFSAGSTSPDVPYSPDPNAIGTVLFYDANGAVQTSGSTTDAVFASYAVASGTGVNNGGQDDVATLYVYTPVSGVLPANWQGNTQLTFSTTYPVTGAGVPASISGQPNATAAGEDIGLTLADAISFNPNAAAPGSSYEGLYEMRILTTRAGQSQDPNAYYAADIKVTGSTWTLINPVPPTQPTDTGSPTDEPTDTGSPTDEPTDTGSPTDEPTDTGSPTEEPTDTGSPTDTSTPTSTATATTTTLAVTPTPLTTKTPATLTATVAPSQAPGTVQFKDGSTNLGAPVAVSGGTAVLGAQTLTLGTHALSAVFTPTDPTAFAASTGGASAPVACGAETADALVSDAGAPIAQGATLREGQTICVSAHGFAASEMVGVTVHSDPVILTPQAADADGTLAYALTVPAGIGAGDHTIELAGALKIVTFSFVITANGTPVATISGAVVDPVTGATIVPPRAAAAVANLANTGQDLARGLIWSTLFLALGALALMIGRRSGSASRGRHS